MGVTLSSVSSENINHDWSNPPQSGDCVSGRQAAASSKKNSLSRLCSALTKCMLFRTTGGSSDSMRREPIRSNLCSKMDARIATGYENNNAIPHDSSPSIDLLSSCKTFAAPSIGDEGSNEQELLSKLVNTSRYILDDQHPEYQNRIEAFRRQFEANGVLVLEDFINPDQLNILVGEALALAPESYHNYETSNVFLEPADLGYPEDHPKRIEGHTSVNVIANDQINGHSYLRKLYNSPQLTSLIESIVNRGPIYHYACPLGAINYQVMEENDQLRWHYDMVEFVASLAIQDASSGGQFEYVKGLRLSDNENFDGVRSVLLGDRANIAVLSAKPGSLILFQGKNTLHRVTPVKPGEPRLNALLGYAFKPDQDSTDFIKLMRYGRTQPKQID